MGVHVRTQLVQYLKPSLTMHRGMPKFWPIALLSVLNSKYKIREQMELERDRVSFLSPSKHGFVDAYQRQNTFDLGFSPKPDNTPAIMDVSGFIKVSSTSMMTVGR